MALMPHIALIGEYDPAVTAQPTALTGLVHPLIAAFVGAVTTVAPGRATPLPFT